MTKIYALILVVLFMGCSGELSLEAQRIAFVGEKPLDCANLGRESGSVVDASGAMSKGAMKKAAENDLRMRVAKIGGDTLYILGEEKSWNDLFSGYELIIKAEVYKCDLGKNTNESSGKSNESNPESAKPNTDSRESNESSAD